MIDEKQLQEWRAKMSDSMNMTRLSYYDFTLKAVPALLDEVARLNARVAHLEGLLSDIDKMQIDCPFCKATIIDSHSDTCPAFTPGGDVK